MSFSDDTTMTVETAAKLREAFGPCSAVYECMTPAEILAEFGRTSALVKDKTVGSFAASMLVTERVSLERSSVSDGEAGDFIGSVRERLLAAGFISSVGEVA